ENYPEGRAGAIEAIAHLPVENRLAAFKNAAQYKESRLNLGGALVYLPSKFRYRAFLLAVRHQGSRSSAIGRLQSLPSRYRYSAFLRAFQYEDSFTRFQKIFQWPKKYDGNVFQNALKLEPDFAAYAIRFLPSSCQTAAFQKAMQIQTCREI